MPDVKISKIKHFDLRNYITPGCSFSKASCKYNMNVYSNKTVDGQNVNEDISYITELDMALRLHIYLLNRPLSYEVIYLYFVVLQHDIKSYFGDLKVRLRNPVPMQDLWWYTLRDKYMASRPGSAVYIKSKGCVIIQCKVNSYTLLP